MRVFFLIVLFLCFSLFCAKAETEQMQITFLKTFDTNCSKNNIVWIGTTNGLYVSLNKNTQKVIGVKDTHIKNIYFEQNKYWVNTHNGLYLIDPKKGLNSAKSINGLEDRIIIEANPKKKELFLHLPNNNLITRDHKKRIYQIDTKNNIIQNYTELENFGLTQIDNNLIENTIFLIGGIKEGVYKIDKNNSSKAELIDELKDKTIIKYHKINNTIWLASLREGIFKLENLQKINNIKGLENKQITQFFNTNDNLIIGTLKDGVYYIKNNEIIPIYSIQDESISQIASLNEEVYIPLDFGGGLYIANINNLNEGLEVDILKRKRILNILSFNNTIWLKTSEREIYKIQDKKAIKILNNIDNFVETGENLFFIDKDHGIYILNSGSLEPIENLENEKVTAIYFKENLYWVETYNHHVFVLQSKNINKAIALNNMFGINIWSIARFDDTYIIGSNKGAFAMKIDTVKDELQIPQIIKSTENESTTSIIKVCDELWIGTLKGIIKTAFPVQKF